MKTQSTEGEAMPRTWQDRWAAFAHVVPLLRMVWNASPILSLSTLSLRFIAAVIPLATLWISKLIIDVIVKAIQHKPVDLSKIWQLLVLEFLLAALADTLSRFTNLVDSILGDLFTNHVSIKLMEHAYTLDLLCFEDPVFHDKMERARRNTTGRLGMLASIAGMTQQIITLISMLSAVIVLSPWLFILLVFATVPLFLRETRFAVLNYSFLYRNTAARRGLDYLRYLCAGSDSAKEVRIFGLGHYLVGRYRQLFEVSFAENRRIAVNRAAHGAVIGLMPAFGYYVSYAFMIWRTLSFTLTIGDLTLAVGAFSRCRSIIESLVSAIVGVSEQALSIQDLFEFFETSPSIVSPLHALPAPRPIRTGFEFREVSFCYPGSRELALNGVSFNLAPGEKLALVGENGAGKTTIVKLLARLYDPTGGRILLDSYDIRDYDVDELRHEIGVIFQDYVRYDMLASENIGIGCVDQIQNEQLIRNAAEKSLAAQLLAKLPKTYSQMLGRRFDGGVDLSTGQWQKIALARAYMRNAQVLILDEPTASLDARAEREAYQRFVELTRDKMSVLISHRFSTVRMADQILVLDQGQVIERGSHSKLISLDGKYAELFELQAAGYR